MNPILHPFSSLLKVVVCYLQPKQANRIGKADVLSFYFDVLSSFNEVLKEEPGLKERVQSLRKRQREDDTQSTTSDNSLPKSPQALHIAEEHFPFKKRQSLWRPYLD